MTPERVILSASPSLVEQESDRTRVRSCIPPAQRDILEPEARHNETPAEELISRKDFARMDHELREQCRSLIDRILQLRDSL